MNRMFFDNLDKNILRALSETILETGSICLIPFNKYLLFSQVLDLKIFFY